MKTVTKFIYPVSAMFALACFALSPMARAVNPPPDGGYPNQNTAEGDGALFSNTTGVGNTANGYFALYNNTTAGANTATGSQALFSNTIGFGNTANGEGALYYNVAGNRNTATGASALFGNFGSNNTGTGYNALLHNSTGSNNTATGVQALGGYSTFDAAGSNNTATGVDALQSNRGSNNTANGVDALYSNGLGNSNTATGIKALFRNETGSNNTANGTNAMLRNTTGNGNIAEGRGALGNNTIGSFNVAVGFNAGANLTTGSDNIDIGALGVAGESNTMRIGTPKQTTTFISGIRGVTTANANAVPVVIDSTGQLGTVSSSRRFKDEIKPMNNSSEAVLGLKPVTFHYKTDKQNTPQFGLIAEEVAKVDPNLVVRDEKGEIFTVRYEAVNAMLLNEFLKEHRTVEELKAIVTKQLAMNAQQQQQIEALTATVQKVSNQLELNKAAQQVASNE